MKAFLRALGWIIVGIALGVALSLVLVGKFKLGEALGLLGVLGLGGGSLAAGKPQASIVDVKKTEEAAREKIKDTPAPSVVASLPADARTGVANAEAAGVAAGLDAATEALHRLGGDDRRGGGG